MMAGQLMFQTTRAAVSALVPRWMNLNSCRNTNMRATASNSSGTTKLKIITKLSPFDVRPRQRSIPMANPTPSGTVMTVTSRPSLSVWMTAACSVGSCNTDPNALDVPVYQRSDRPWNELCDLPLLNENSTAMAMGTMDQTEVEPREGLRGPMGGATARCGASGRALACFGRRERFLAGWDGHGRHQAFSFEALAVERT